MRSTSPGHGRVPAAVRSRWVLLATLQTGSPTCCPPRPATPQAEATHAKASQRTRPCNEASDAPMPPMRLLIMQVAFVEALMTLIRDAINDCDTPTSRESHGKGGRTARACTRSVLVLTLAALLAGCTSTPLHPTTDAATSPPMSTSQSPSASVAPVRGDIVTLRSCCTATLPVHWTVPQVVDNTLEGSYDPSGKLYVTWQVVGPAHRCPTEPPALIESLTSPSHASGEVIAAVEPLTVNGRHVVVYISAPRNATPRGYQYANADAVVGANCVDLGSAEYGVASAANLKTLLQILATTKPLASPIQP